MKHLIVKTSAKWSKSQKQLQECRNTVLKKSIETLVDSWCTKTPSYTKPKVSRINPFVDCRKTGFSDSVNIEWITTTVTKKQTRNSYKI